MFNKPLSEMTLKDVAILYVGSIFVKTVANVFLLPPLRKLDEKLTIEQAKLDERKKERKKKRAKEIQSIR